MGTPETAARSLGSSCKHDVQPPLRMGILKSKGDRVQSFLFSFDPVVHQHYVRRLLPWLLALGLPACQQVSSQPIRPTPLPQADQLQVYTNHEPSASYTEPYRHQTRSGDDLEQVILETILSAQSTVDVAVQELRSPKIAQALVERQKAGVKVRVILENTYARPFSAFTTQDIAQLPERERSRYQEARQLIDQDGDGQLSQTEINQRDALVMLDHAKIPRIDDTADGSAGSNLMHHKFVVVDQRQVIVTSANFTTSDIHGDFQSPSSQGNANTLLRLDSPELAALFTQEFKLMWGDGPGGKPDSRFGIKKPFRPVQSVTVGTTRVDVHFSPSARSVPWSQSSNGLIGKVLATATQSISMALFVFSDQNLVNALEPLPQNGVEIKALIDPGFAYRSYSEALDMMGITLSDECKYEPGNHPWQKPIATVGVPRMPPGDLLHHKFGIVDQQIVIVGSHNWTDAANQGNDETLLVIYSPVVAAHYQREFERLYNAAILGIPPAIQKKADAQKHQCPPPRSTAPTVLPTKQPIKPSAHRQSKTGVKPIPIKTDTVVSSLVNLNTATQAELEALPGVGPGLAKRIIAAREQQPFRSLQDLDHVPGVGPKLLNRLSDRVTW